MKDKNIKHISINIMEELVAEEVTRQMKRHPENITQYINRVEVATFALNRLPPLYASCHKGLNKQKLKGKSDLSVQITKAVRQGFVAIQKDVLRYSTPLQIAEDFDTEISQNNELEEARRVLNELGECFPNGKVSWKELVQVVKPLLLTKFRNSSDKKEKAASRKIMWF